VQVALNAIQILED